MQYYLQAGELEGAQVRVWIHTHRPNHTDMQESEGDVG